MDPDTDATHDWGALPVWDTVISAYRRLFQNLGPFFVLAALPIIAAALVKPLTLLGMGALAGLVGWIVPSLGDTYSRFYLSYLMLPIGFLVSTLIWSVFAVAWLRFILLGRRKLEFGHRVWKSLLWVLLARAPLVAIPAVALAGFFGLISVGVAGNNLLLWVAIMLVATGATLIGCLVVARCIIILPSISVDHGMDIRQIWKLTKGSALRILCGLFLAYTPIFYVVNKLIQVVGFRSLLGSGKFALLVVQSLLEQIVTFGALAIALGVVAIAFRHFTGWQPPATNVPAE